MLVSRQFYGSLQSGYLYEITSFIGLITTATVSETFLFCFTLIIQYIYFLLYQDNPLYQQPCYVLISYK